jgi:hypothetical protein
LKSSQEDDDIHPQPFQIVMPMTEFKAIFGSVSHFTGPNPKLVSI